MFVHFVLMLTSFLTRLIHLMLLYNHEFFGHDHLLFFLFVQLTLFVCVHDSVSQLHRTVEDFCKLGDFVQILIGFHLVHAQH